MQKNIKKIHYTKKKITRDDARPKYTKVDSINKKFKGWDRKIIRRFDCSD